MAGNVIKQLLVGIGTTYDNRGERQFEQGIGNVERKALQLGGVLAGAFGAKALTVDFANSRDELGRFADLLGVTADDVNAVGNAFEQQGGSLASYMSQLEGIERLRAGLRVGNAEFVSIAGRAQIDTSQIIEASDATEAFLSLADEFASFNEQQRLNAAEALGLDATSIRLLSMGPDELRKLVERQRELRPVTESMTSTAREFNEQMYDLSTNIGGVSDQISDRLLPEVNKITQSINAWFTENNQIIDQNLDEVLDPIADNFSTIATASGLFVASGILGTFSRLATLVPIVGTGMASVAASASAIAGIGAAGAIGYGVGSVLEPFIDEDIKEDIGRTTARVAAFFGDEEAQQALETERVTLEAQGIEQPGTILWDWSHEDVNERLGLDLPEWFFKPIGELGQPDEPTQPQRDDDFVPTGTLPNVSPDPDVPQSDVIPIEVTPQQRDLDVNVTPLQGELTPYEPMVFDMLPQQGDLTPYDDMSVNVTPLQDGLDAYETQRMTVPVDVSIDRIEQPERQRQESSRVNSVQQSQPIRVEANLNLDGTLIDQRIIEVNERQNTIALENLSTNIRG